MTTFDSLIKYSANADATAGDHSVSGALDGATAANAASDGLHGTSANEAALSYHGQDMALSAGGSGGADVSGGAHGVDASSALDATGSANDVSAHLHHALDAATSGWQHMSASASGGLDVVASAMHSLMAHLGGSWTAVFGF